MVPFNISLLGVFIQELISVMLDNISFSRRISWLKIPIIKTVVAGAKQTLMDVDAATNQETAEIHASLKS